MRHVRIITLILLLFFSGYNAGLEAGERIDLNRATKEELIELPGIGPVLAERIIQFRRQHGGFRGVEELLEVKGIGRKRFERIKDLVVVSETPGLDREDGRQKRR